LELELEPKQIVSALVIIYWMKEVTGRERRNRNVKSCENLFSALKLNITADSIK
jgi:hypothetical protein